MIPFWSYCGKAHIILIHNIALSMCFLANGIILRIIDSEIRDDYAGNADNRDHFATTPRAHHSLDTVLTRMDALGESALSPLDSLGACNQPFTA